MSKLYTNMEETIDVQSTSYSTANVTPIILNETEMVKTSFEPILVDNNKDNKSCVGGKLVHQRKKKKELKFPTEIVSKKDIKTGDILEIRLSTGELRKLYDGLTELYKLYFDIGYVPLGNNTYKKVDSSLLSIINQFEIIGEFADLKEIIKCLNILIKILSKKGDLNNISEQLLNLSNAENLDKLYDTINIAKLKQVLSFLENNLYNGKEEDWQKFFKANQWVISQLFSYPTTIYEDKAYLGGKNSHNKEGKIVDFLYANDLSKNVALVEIKTPTTKLLGDEYRANIFSMSEDVSGGINQLLRYKDTLLKDWNSVFVDGEDIIAFNPFCILIIGNTQELNNKDKIASFELWRSSLNGITVITFDELKQKIENLIMAFCK